MVTVKENKFFVIYNALLIFIYSVDVESAVYSTDVYLYEDLMVTNGLKALFIAVT